MLPDIQRTIVALASGSRPARRSIVRLAGPDVRQILDAICVDLPSQFLEASSLTWCDARCILTTVRADFPVTILYWPDNRSYTGSPAAEIHLIGCVPLAEAVINECCQHGAEPAERGEFTLRAFLAGKLDLAQAEAVLGVIEADSQASLTTALRQLGGNLAPAIAPLRASLIEIVAELEAGLDFVDEDIEFITNRQVIEQLERVSEQLDEFASRLETRSSTDRVPRVVLTGLPNSGKSTLFNAISGQRLAIVADVPGTTRDYLQHRVRSVQVAFDLIDTAGWEQLSGSAPRAMAQQQLSQCLMESQLIAACIDMSQPTLNDQYWRELSSANTQAGIVIVGTKSDLVGEDRHDDALNILEKAKELLQAQKVLITSKDDHQAIDGLVTEFANELLAMDHGSRSSGLQRIAMVHETAVRCRAALAAARSGVAAALETARAGGGEELIAAELRLVLEDLASIIGEVHSDDVLGEIFSRFCIGK